MTQPTLDLRTPLPDLPSKVHGIKSLDPPTVQCDGCLLTYSRPSLGLAVLTGGIIFNHRHPGRRLCADCRKTEGWTQT